MERLSIKEQIEIATQACLQLLPVVGGALTTIYFGRKQEIRFKRLEQFYVQVSDELKKIQDRLRPIEEHDEELLLSIMEKLNERIEGESVKNKNKLPRPLGRGIVQMILKMRRKRRGIRPAASQLII
jgi:hypothetical protein